MKRRKKLLNAVPTAIALALLGTAAAQAVQVNRAPAVQATGNQATSKQAAGTLRPAVNGEVRSLQLPGFGTVRHYASESGAGRPLVLTHSVNAAASAYEMKPLWDAYAGKRPVYALEWPGFGQSDRPDTRYTPELMAQALQALVSELDTDVDVVALSLGSEFAARAALQEPRIRSLALLSPSGLGKSRGNSQQSSASDRGERTYQTLSRIENPLYSLLRTRASLVYYLNKSFRGPVPEDVVQYAWETSRQPGASNAPLHFISGKLFTPNAYGELYSRLTVPTAVLYDRDGFVSFDLLPQFDAKSNVAAVRIAGTDGLPQWEQPAAVQQVLGKLWNQAR
ncbi:alpha/beta fold hydrolase [Deinococcus sp. SL84]|uniref:alpha/beta fold hydrolase n=1 Tax=Deinococcus sp. SL84 TaxID=2994663 RepID=UPI00227248C7|nr:alpha/beta fold hydrolase [Deinococcus sp. SL84]MCY1702349.1 alpha/beta fold hydrolase [Deinococcus sp. SL84]